MSSLRCRFRCLRDVGATISRQARPPAAFTSPKCSNARRTITTTARRQDEDSQITGGGQDEGLSKALQPIAASIDVPYMRPMPVSPSYFSRQPEFNDKFVLIQDLARRYGRLPTLPPGQVERVAWKTKDQIRLAVGESVRARDYATCLALVKRLHQIHPDLMPEAVKDGIRPFKRDINVYLNVPKAIPIDRFGRSHGVGRRKSSVAQAWLVEGTGQVLINGKLIHHVLPRSHDRGSAMWPLKVMERIDKYNVWARVKGGGTTGQAEALAMAIAKALIVHEPALKTPLRKGGCITRDPRTVERKKTGHVKARKRPAWVKR
ncbi:37S ribosomal protein S9 [Xylariaceae sp. FL0662B]|nr:37S ribosomal protein S9 [Xylariaceae sp. FL0662B]